MEKIEFLPLGSIVIVKGGVQKTVIIARGLVTNIGGKMNYFDYGGCIYPNGLVGDAVMYFNHKDIQKIVAKGYSDADDELMVSNINDWLVSSKIAQGDPYELNKQNQVK